MTRFDLDAIRDRLDVATVLGALGIDPPSGRRRIPCPVHGGNDPNFSITADGSRWTCWSHCGAGDVITLIERLNNCTIGSAIRIAAELAGIAPQSSTPPAEIETSRVIRQRTAALRRWRSLEAMRLAIEGNAADVESARACALLHTAGPDDDDAWAHAAAAARRVEDLDWQRLTIESAPIGEVAELWLAETTRRIAA